MADQDVRRGNFAGFEKSVEIGGNVFGVAGFFGWSGVGPADAGAVVRADASEAGNVGLDSDPGGNGEVTEAGVEDDGGLGFVCCCGGGGSGRVARAVEVHTAATDVEEDAGRREFVVAVGAGNELVSNAADGGDQDEEKEIAQAALGPLPESG